DDPSLPSARIGKSNPRYPITSGFGKVSTNETVRLEAAISFRVPPGAAADSTLALIELRVFSKFVAVSLGTRLKMLDVLPAPPDAAAPKDSSLIIETLTRPVK